MCDFHTIHSGKYLVLQKCKVFDGVEESFLYCLITYLILYVYTLVKPGYLTE